MIIRLFFIWKLVSVYLPESFTLIFIANDEARRTAISTMNNLFMINIFISEISKFLLFKYSVNLLKSSTETAKHQNFCSLILEVWILVCVSPELRMMRMPYAIHRLLVLPHIHLSQRVYHLQRNGDIAQGYIISSFWTFGPLFLKATDVTNILLIYSNKFGPTREGP